MQRWNPVRNDLELQHDDDGNDGDGNDSGDGDGDGDDKERMVANTVRPQGSCNITVSWHLLITYSVPGTVPRAGQGTKDTDPGEAGRHS